MLRDPCLRATAALTRAQLAMFHALGDEVSLTEDDRRRTLDLDDSAWSSWSDFLSDGPLPAEPPLPVMLLRLGETTFNLSVVAGLGCAVGAD